MAVEKIYPRLKVLSSINKSNVEIWFVELGVDGHF